MEYKLLHLIRGDRSQDDVFFKASMGSVSGAVAAGLYEHVATLDCEDLTELFRLTNSIEEAWFENPAAGALKTPLRSTSVGDIVYTEDGKFLSCQAAGWKELTAMESKPLLKALDDFELSSWLKSAEAQFDRVYFDILKDKILESIELLRDKQPQVEFWAMIFAGEDYGVSISAKINDEWECLSDYMEYEVEEILPGTSKIITNIHEETARAVQMRAIAYNFDEKFPAKEPSLDHDDFKP